MRFAFVTDELPQAGIAGHGAMNHAIIAWLRGNGHEVHVLLVRPRLPSLAVRYEAAAVAGIGVRQWRGRVIVTSWRAGMGILARKLLAPLPFEAKLRKRLRAGRYGLVDAVLGAFVTPAQTAWCVRRIAEMAPDTVFAETIFRAPLFREPALAKLQRICIAQDLFHRRHAAMRRAGYTVYPADLPRDGEAELLNLADAIVAIQPDEAAEFQKMCPDRTVCTAPMPALPCQRPSGSDKIPDRLVFVGSATLPNLDGLRWLFAEIWPRLIALRPAATLDLVGDCGSAFAILPAGVSRLGRVVNLSPILHRAALAVSPLRVGSGLKIKMLDYARHGLMTVATTESLSGFAADPNAPFVAADDAAMFAAAIASRLAADDAGGEQRALEYVGKYYTVNASFSGLAAVLRK
jgi:hypothetical protein